MRHSMPGKFKLLVTACGAAALLAAGAGMAGASSSSSLPQQARGRPMSHIGAEATYGVKDGKPFMHLIKGTIVGHFKLSSIKLGSIAAAVECEEYISNVTKALGNVPFYWVTQQTCTGAFGYQFMSTQMWRSSYRGPLGYGGWAHTPEQTVSFISRNWDIACNYGHGSYSYYPVMYGSNLATGNGPTIRSENQINTANCGPNPP